MVDSGPEWREKFTEIVDDPRYEEFSYGDKRRDWHPNFIDYMAFIVNHPNFADMPNAKDDDGKIMWNTPSERQGGRFQNSHELREKWWQKKASEVGIERTGNWKTRTAKSINPTGESVCQICGTTVSIYFEYLNKHILPSLNSLLRREDGYKREDLVSIHDSIDILEKGNLRNEDGTLDDFLDDVKENMIFNFFNDNFGLPNDLSRDTEQVRQEIPNIIQREPQKLSPGKTGNAPDRMDGLHSYCYGCRHKEDTGRLPENLAQYHQDRRAFEYWTDGNWALASNLANRVGRGECQYPSCDKTVDLTADHIGPLAIGFRNTDLLTGLCASHNSGMGRRLNIWKMEILLSAEREGKDIISRHAQKLWNECKNSIENNSQAKELSNRLRDNQHHYLLALNELRVQGHEDLLMIFLEPGHGQYKYEFEELDQATLNYKNYSELKRNQTYARSLSSRMVRIAFGSLSEYSDAENRNTRNVTSGAVEEIHEKLLSTLSTPPQNREFKKRIQEALNHDSDEDIDAALQDVFIEYGFNPPTVPHGIPKTFYEYMDTIGQELASVHRKRNQ